MSLRLVAVQRCLGVTEGFIDKGFKSPRRCQASLVITRSLPAALTSERKTTVGPTRM